MADNGSGPWIERGAEVLAGCDRTLVVIGAQAEKVRSILPSGVAVLENPDHAAGMGSSLRVGLTALERTPVVAVLVMLVDLPDVGPAVADRLLEHLDPEFPARTLVRAGYRGQPGHPVLIGRDHFAGVIAAAVGDRGARDYLATQRTRLIECGDLGGGRDVDRRDQL